MALVTTTKSIIRSYKKVFTTFLRVRMKSTAGVKAQRSISDIYTNTHKRFRMKTELEISQSVTLFSRFLRSSTYSLGIWLAALARSTAPGLG